MNARKILVGVLVMGATLVGSSFTSAEARGNNAALNMMAVQDYMLVQQQQAAAQQLALQQQAAAQALALQQQQFAAQYAVPTYGWSAPRYVAPVVYPVHHHRVMRFERFRR